MVEHPHYINLSSSFIYTDIFTKFAGNVYDCDNMCLCKIWPHFEKHNGRHRRLFEKHKDTLNLEILQLAGVILLKRCYISLTFSPMGM